MENNLHLNERLEKQKLNDLFAERGSIDVNNEEERVELLNRIIGELVMNTSFVSPVTIEDSENGDRNITFQLIRSPEGEKYFPVFTSSEDLELWSELDSKQTALFGFDDYAGLLTVNGDCAGFVVNPFSDNFKVEKPLVMQWLENKQMLVNGHANHLITKDTEYEFYAPEPYPFELSENLAAAAKERPEVERVWLRGIKLEGRDAYLAVVEHTGDKNEIIPALGECTKAFLNGMHIHFVEYVPGFAEEAVENVVPIYSKEK